VVSFPPLCFVALILPCCGSCIILEIAYFDHVDENVKAPIMVCAGRDGEDNNQLYALTFRSVITNKPGSVKWR
jgi:hypothetical protein